VVIEAHTPTYNKKLEGRRVKMAITTGYASVNMFLELSDVHKPHPIHRTSWVVRFSSTYLCFK